MILKQELEIELKMHNKIDYKNKEITLYEDDNNNLVCNRIPLLKLSIANKCVLFY